MSELINTKYEQTKYALSSSWLALSHACWAMLEGQVYVFVTHQVRAEWKHPPSCWFWIPPYSISPSVSLLLFACIERKTKSSLMTVMFPFLRLFTSVTHLSPLSKVWWQALQAVPLFILQLIPFPHIYLFSWLMKCMEHRLSLPTTLSWLKLFIENTSRPALTRPSHILIFSIFILAVLVTFLIVVSLLCMYGDMADWLVRSLTILMVFLHCRALWATLCYPGGTWWRTNAALLLLASHSQLPWELPAAQELLGQSVLFQWSERPPDGEMSQVYLTSTDLMSCAEQISSPQTHYMVWTLPTKPMIQNL